MTNDKDIRAQRASTLCPGFTLVETILAITVIGLVITAAAQLTQSSLNVGRISTHELVAYHLAEEGLEVMRAQRDTNWLKNYAWNRGLEQGTYTIQTNEAAGFNEAPWKVIKVGGIDAPETVLSPTERYTRLVTLSYSEEVSTEDPTIKWEVMHVSSKVSWKEREREKVVTLSMDLTDWKKGPI